MRKDLKMIAIKNAEKKLEKYIQRTKLNGFSK